MWWQADEAQRERWIDPSSRVDLVRAVVGRGAAASWARLAGGVGLLVVALVLFAVQTGETGVARDVLLAGALGVVGLALIVGPWLFRLSGDLSEERAARSRSQERADVAAHLHDSVWTLALIQARGRRAHGGHAPRGRRRDLRGWLYGDQAHPGGPRSRGAQAAAAEVEDAHGVPVDVVTVEETPR